MFAYLDSTQVVVATSLVSRSLLEAQSKNPAITSIITNAPDEIYPKNIDLDHTYFVKDNGDGSDITHYRKVEDISKLKDIRYREIDARTRELISFGFEFPQNSCQFFSLSIPAQIRLANAERIRDDANFVYPLEWNFLDDSGSFKILDSATLHAFHWEAVKTYRRHIDLGTQLKTEIRNAQTKAALDAIIDQR